MLNVFLSLKSIAKGECWWCISSTQLLKLYEWGALFVVPSFEWIDTFIFFYIACQIDSTTVALSHILSRWSGLHGSCDVF